MAIAKRERDGCASRSHALRKADAAFLAASRSPRNKNSKPCALSASLPPGRMSESMKHASLQSMPAGLLQQPKGRKPGGPARRCIAVCILRLHCVGYAGLTASCFQTKSRMQPGIRHGVWEAGCALGGQPERLWGRRNGPPRCLAGGGQHYTALLVEERV